MLLFLAFPIYYMVITSLKTPSEAYRLPPTLWPQNLSVESYPYVVGAWNYWRTLGNTVLVAGTAALTATVLGGICAYGFSRMEFTGKTILYGILVATIAIPGMVTVGPVFLAYKDLRLLDTHIGLILVFAPNSSQSRSSHCSPTSRRFPRNSTKRRRWTAPVCLTLCSGSSFRSPCRASQ
ncbi:hypothetical protein AJ87_21325 [Rhizobium yanglingense]|nr:hypothetical protein AJ87_21325 [Rhizobium yanglingense]